MSRIVGFNERLKVISKFGSYLKWILEAEAQGKSPTQSQLMNHIKAIDEGQNSNHVLNQLVESEAVIIDDNLLRINGPVSQFILWAADASSMLPGSRIEQILVEIITQISAVYLKMRENDSSIRQKEAYIKERFRDVRSKLLSLRGSSDENIRTVINATSSLRLLKEEDRLMFIARVSKLWEDDIDPISYFRRSSSDLQIQRRDARAKLQWLATYTISTNSLRRDSENMLDNFDKTWDRIANSHDVMINEVRPLYKLAQKMKSTISIINAAENLVNHINTSNTFRPNEELGIPSITVEQIFSDISIDSFICTLGNVEEEDKYIIPTRGSLDEIERLNHPIDILQLLEEHTLIEDAMEFVLNHPLLVNHTVEECAIAIYSNRKEIKQSFDRNASKKEYSNKNSEHILVSRPLKLEVK